MPSTADLVSFDSYYGNTTLELRAPGKVFEQVEAVHPPYVLEFVPDMPLGMVSYQLQNVTPGSIATVELAVPDGSLLDGYYKQNVSTGAIERFDFDGSTGAVFNGNTITLYLQDGGRGDDDGVANGVIVDPGGPGGGGGGTNHAPVPVADSYSLVHDRFLQTNLLANDTDADGNPLKVVVITEPMHGTLTFQAANPYATGVFVYRPNPKYVGADSFTYKISDGTVEAGPVTVSITVTNSTPVGTSDSYTGASEDAQITGNVRTNDSDADGDPFQSFVAATTSHGVLILKDNGSFTYTPDANYTGSDTFTYTLTDGLATSNPITVNLTVPSGAPFDLDGHDRSTQTTWMSESDESIFGLGVSTSDSATVFARVYSVPSNMVVQRRRILFNPNVLAVNGVTQPGYVELSPTGGNEVLTVTALTTGYGSSTINYEVLGTLDQVNFVAMEPMQVVEQKAELRQLEFTSDHNVIRSNTLIENKSGDRYKDVEFVRATKYNAPMTQSLNYPTVPSKLKVKVTVDWAGIPAATTFKIVGTSTETALQFDSGPLTTGNLAGAGTVELTATNNVGQTIRTINGSIEWKMIVNPGPNEKTLAMGTSGSHKIYVLFGTPGKQDKEPFQATDVRMDLTIPVAAKALQDAQAAAPAGSAPTWQRVAYHVVKQQKVLV